MRPKVFAANWKMNKTSAEAENFLQTWINLPELEGDHQVLFFAPATTLYVFKGLKGTLHAEFGAQNMYPKDGGAFTGELSPLMVADAGCQWILIGHSERRHVFKETDELIHEKVLCAIQHGLKAMICVGELLDERKAGKERQVVAEQIKYALDGVTAEQLAGCAIAYEPVWAIGTGENATSVQAVEMCAFVREQVAEAYGRGAAEALPVLYGGSVKPHNISEYTHDDAIDGALVGGASLKTDAFYEIIKNGRK